ncbi:probable ribosome production factor 1 [Palaemon carinicauda]|uniref:probable ribosome production factor 1 n=1 Tax=Palaemon carinicauda TaxID=392227 RepID=UPI0035B5CE49
MAKGIRGRAAQAKKKEELALKAGGTKPKVEKDTKPKVEKDTKPKDEKDTKPEDEDDTKPMDEEETKSEDEEETKPGNEDDEEEEEEVLFPQMGPCYGIKNKFLRMKRMREVKAERVKANIERAKERVRARKEWRKAGNKGKPPVVKEQPTKLPHTIESLREPDVTYVDSGDQEVEFDEATDKYANYYAKTYEPKVLITSSVNAHPRTLAFIKELCRMIPGSVRKFRRKSSVKKMVSGAKSHEFTDIIIINEDKRRPNGFLLIHLPEGPSAYFRLSNPKICKDIHRKYTEITAHRPEVILNNFRTRLGQMIGRMLGALFHYDPEFKGRRVCTFHNQRDYIFFRHHRYEFQNTEKVHLRELGPRFTLRLQWLQDGTFDGDYEWLLKRHEMEPSRRRFVL